MNCTEFLHKSYITTNSIIILQNSTQRNLQFLTIHADINNLENQHKVTPIKLIFPQFTLDNIGMLSIFFILKKDE